MHIDPLWTRSSRVVRASDYQCWVRSRHSWSWGTADETVLKWSTVQLMQLQGQYQRTVYFRCVFLHFLAQISMQWFCWFVSRTWAHRSLPYLEYYFNDTIYIYFRPGLGDGVQAPLPRGVGHHRGHVHPDIQGAAWPLPGRVFSLHKNSVADPGCLSWIPDPDFFHPGSCIRIFSIPDPHQRI